ncbi:hypothetical protein [Tenacibaculum sp. 190524A05c]|uniref:hypothetical protein n=1 Tax=Tenacibaculum platacis TaxID=3137852 RepID=UPI0031FB803A
MCALKKEINNYDEWFSTLKVGMKCQGNHEANWYEVEIIKVSDDQDWVEITYPGWGAEWNEIISKSSNRLKPFSATTFEESQEQDFLKNLEVGQRILGESDNAWYEVEVLNVDGDNVNVTWIGWNSSFDEVIPISSGRLKPLDSEFAEQYGVQNGYLNLNDISNNMIENFVELTNYIKGLEKANSLLKARIEALEQKFDA